MLRSNDFLFSEKVFPSERESVAEDIFDVSCEVYFRPSVNEDHQALNPDEVPVDEYNTNEVVQRRQRRAPDRLGVLTGEWWNLFENANVAKTDG